MGHITQEQFETIWKYAFSYGLHVGVGGMEWRRWHPFQKRKYSKQAYEAYQTNKKAFDDMIGRVTL